MAMPGDLKEKANDALAQRNSRIMLTGQGYLPLPHSELFVQHELGRTCAAHPHRRSRL
jgi:hypothetical protein